VLEFVARNAKATAGSIAKGGHTMICNACKLEQILDEFPARDVQVRRDEFHSWGFYAVTVYVKGEEYIRFAHVTPECVCGRAYDDTRR
jgi:hypothetical protein